VEGSARRLVKAQGNGWLTGPRTLYASAPSAERVAWALPGDFQMLLFRFPQGVAAFAELVGKPRLVARVGIDRCSARFINVRLFNHQS
jgi:hypothetical protein